ncbi:hypothetical protein PsYK624_136540 [Phanerochaete sordida]|uniref:Uncharacterized protein n=1 Tax=Phanerochaete sordida TaxID=48140 RepID=A0A9P3LJJ3_9APHY|nr:hypothetical protein PsYK624_136540 [Phanerochaete sordida]
MALVGGAICVDMRDMDKILEIYEEDSDLACQPEHGSDGDQHRAQATWNTTVRSDRPRTGRINRWYDQHKVLKHKRCAIRNCEVKRPVKYRRAPLWIGHQDASAILQGQRRL